jgi:hypothetical protein
MVVSISAERELDQILSGDPNPIVAEFAVWNETLQVPEHAIDQYIFWLKRSKRARSENISYDRNRITCDLQDQLSASFLAKKKGSTEENIVFRFWKGFIYILKWDVVSQLWLLKTAYQMLTPRKRGFTIIPAKRTQLPLTWSPTYCF